MKTFKIALAAMMTAAIGFGGGVPFTPQTDAMADGKAESRPVEELKPVKTQEVCMVNNAFMGKTQMPVQVNGKTYYGCCKNCAKRLKSERLARVSKDPLTGKEVDKATAFIAAKPDGDVLYFESAETAQRYGVTGASGSNTVR